MDSLHARQRSQIKVPPASKKPRALAFLAPEQGPNGPADDVRKLAREVLTLSRHMRDKDMTFVLQLKNTDFGPGIRVMHCKTGLPCKQLIYDLLCDLASPSNDE